MQTFINNGSNQQYMRTLLSLDEYLAKANTYAQQGEILGMMIALDTASLWSQHLRQDISTYRTEIEHKGYTNALPLILSEAREYITQNQIDQAQHCLTEAEKYAKIVHEDISNKTREIKRLMYN